VTKNHGPIYLYSCAGASDVGAIADFAARALGRDPAINLGCLACVGAGNENPHGSIPEDARVVVVDGCGDDCARQCVERNGLTVWLHIRLTDEGFVKGKNPTSPARVGEVVKMIREKIKKASLLHPVES